MLLPYIFNPSGFSPSDKGGRELHEGNAKTSDIGVESEVIGVVVLNSDSQHSD